MVTLNQKIACERKVREMLDDGGLPPPDAVEYGERSIRCVWLEPRAAVIFDLDDPEADGTDPEEWPDAPLALVPSGWHERELAAGEEGPAAA